VFRDQLSHDVGTVKPGSKESVKLDTPGLAELWRTAPYLHDGSAARVREVVTTRNREDRHGKTSRLSSEDIDALVEYLLSR
jgi:cytochrome c peroxidase